MRTGTPALRWIETLRLADAPVVGGKAAGLGELCAAGLPVPPGFVLLPGDGAPEEEAAALEAAYAELARRVGRPEPVVAVRSSARGEDGAEASFAGQYTTLLGVSGLPALREAVAACRASAEAAHLEAYRHRRGLPASAPDALLGGERGAGPAIGVVVQALVEPDCAGVAFGADPVTGDRGVVLVEAAYGLGESVVSGRVDPDRAVVEAATGALRHLGVGEKAVAAVARPEGVAWLRVREADRAEPALDAAGLCALAALVLRAQAHFGHPLDVEWAYAAGAFWLLQARPITALPPEPPPGGWAPPGPGVWKRVNVAEHFPGPLSPLARTLLLPPLAKAIVELGATGGQRVPDHHLSCVHGTLYARTDWGADRLTPLRMIPGFVAMAIASPARWEGKPGAHAERVSALLARPPGGPAEEAAWAEAFAASLAAVWQRVHDLSAGWRWSEYLLRRALGGDLQRAGVLLGGYPGPAGRFAADLAALGPLIRAAAARSVSPASAGPAAPPEGTPGPEPDAALAAAIAALAERGMDLPASLDPAVPLPYATPERVAHHAAGMAKVPGAGPSPAELRSRAAAEAVAEAPFWKRPWLRLVLAWAQAYAAAREPALGELGRGYGAFRARLLALGSALGLLEPELVFELEWAEIRAAVRGAPLPAASALAERRTERGRQAAYAPPECLGGPLAGPASRELYGLAASPGRATGKVRVVMGPEDFALFEPGEILVAPATTPAWTPLFPLAAAIVTDVGGPLSHGSIVAREFGVPAVLGVGAATRRLRTGQIVTVEGDTGRIVPVR